MGMKKSDIYIDAYGVVRGSSEGESLKKDLFFAFSQNMGKLKPCISCFKQLFVQ